MTPLRTSRDFRLLFVAGTVFFACVVGVALTAAWLRDFWRYDARTDEHAVAERAVRAAAGEA